MQTLKVCAFYEMFCNNRGIHKERLDVQLLVGTPVGIFVIHVW